MKLLFERTINRQQCGIEVVANGYKVPCAFSSSTKVTIPIGLQYVDGKLSFNLSKPAITIPICKNHEMQLNSAFRDIYGNDES